MPSEPFILGFLYQRMRNQRIAKVELALCEASTKSPSQADTSRWTKSSANKLSPLKHKLGPRPTTTATQKKVTTKPTAASTKKKVVPNAKVLSFDVFGYQTYVIIKQLVM
ncbi:hypothetical protein Tco_1071209 [Tanacetum coccineum]|uniref:Uncharacterized protein n=1 Tax=Tanacetum coccineum TaxID=301880 RepID=A0ABQ5HNP0_9ASTR